MKDDISQAKQALARLHRTAYLQAPEVPPVRNILDALAIRKDDLIVEFGAGEGHFALPIARRLEELGGTGVVFACDFSKTLVDRVASEAIAQGVDDQVRAICLDDIKPRTLPFSDAHVNRVLSVNTLQHFADPAPYLMEIARILTSGGGFLIADWRTSLTVSPGETPLKALTPEELGEMLNAAGLASAPAIQSEGFTWIISGEKLSG